MEKLRIALACQGGGSHTAFTAGVLGALLSSTKVQFEIVGLSGTSGGALCAALSWFGLVTGGRQKAAELLKGFWEDNSASSAWEAYLNYLAVCITRMRSFMALPEPSPYSAISGLGNFTVSDWAHGKLARLLEKQIDFGAIPRLVSDSAPELYIGAANVLSGEFEVFTEKNLTVEALLASTAIPSLFKAVRVGQKYYWDGLFSQNPPIRNFLTGKAPEKKPDQIWIIQINPAHRERVPTTVEEIMDRRNELAGNLSLNQEVAFIDTINEILTMDRSSDSPVLGRKYKTVLVRKIQLDLELDYASKLDRDPGFIQDLIRKGMDRANDFLLDEQV